MSDRFCVSCGKTIVQDTAFCPNCGSAQRAAQVQNINLNVGSKQTNILALVSLVLTILIFFTGGITWIPAVICGHIARTATKRDPNLGGGGMATAALVISYLLLAGLILVGCIIGMMAASAQ